MGKSNKDYKLEGNIINVIDQHTKKGKIRGKNKTQTKILVGACPHHTFNGKGKLKTTLGNNGKNKCTCRRCKADFEPRTYTKEEVIKKIAGAKEVVNQMKYLSVAVKAGPEAVKFSTEAGSILELLPKFYRKTAKIAEKSESVRKKRKNKKHSSANDYGSWA